MQAVRRGGIFFVHALRLAREHPGLFGPTLRGLAVGLVLALAGLVPLALSALLAADFSQGFVISGLILAWLVLLALAISIPYSAETIRLAYRALSGERVRRARPGEPLVPAHWGASLPLGIGLPLVRLLGAAGLRPNLVEGDNRWADAPELVLPAVLVEERRPGGAFQRVNSLVSEHSLLIDPPQVGVQAFNRLAGLALLLLGGGLAWFAAARVLASQTGPYAVEWALAAAGLLVGLFALTAGALAGYTSAVYQAGLFRWARAVEAARQDGTGVAATPAPLAAALGRPVERPSAADTQQAAADHPQERGSTS